MTSLASAIAKPGASYDATLRNRLDSNEKTRNSIDHQMKELERQLISLKARRNQHASISVLPPEVLSLILVRVIQTHGIFRPVPWRTCVDLSLVCKNWRTVALATPAFWSNIGLLALPQMPQMLARSKQSPFSIRFEAPSQFQREPPLKSTLKELLTPERLQRLHISCRSEIMEGHLESFPEDAPLLESLHLRILGHKPTSYSLPLQVLLSTKPALRHVTLDACHLPWTSVPEGSAAFSNLDTFTLQRISPPIPSAILWDILSSSPNLNELELSDAISPTLGIDASGARTLELPRLDKMVLAGHAQPLSQLLRSLKRPPSLQAEVRLRLDTQPDQIPNLKTIIESCGVSVDNGSSTLWNSLQVILEDGQVDLIFRDTLPGSGPAKFPPIPHRCFDERIPLDPMSPEPRLALFFEEVPAEEVLRNIRVQGLETLSVSILDREPIPDIRWRGLFERHPAIRFLHLSGGTISTGLRALGSPEDALPKATKGKRGSKSTRGKKSKKPAARKQTKQQSEFADTPTKQLLLPALHTIQLEDVNFVLNHYWRDCVAFTAVGDMLIDRWNYDVPVEMLNIVNCRGFNSATVKELQDVGGATHLRWDLNYKSSSSYDYSDSDFDSEFEDAYYAHGPYGYEAFDLDDGYDYDDDDDDDLPMGLPPFNIAAAMFGF